MATSPVSKLDMDVFSTPDSKTQDRHGSGTGSGANNVSPIYVDSPTPPRSKRIRKGCQLVPRDISQADVSKTPTSEWAGETAYFQCETKNEVIRSAMRELFSRLRKANGNEDVRVILCVEPPLLAAYDLYIHMMEDERLKNLDGTQK